MSPLLRLVHSLDPKRGMRYSVDAELSSLYSSETVGVHFQQHALGPEAFILGSSEKAHLQEKSLRSRHIAIVCQPCSTGVTLRVIALHPDLSLTVSSTDKKLQEKKAHRANLVNNLSFDEKEKPTRQSGGVVAHRQVEVLFQNFKLRVRAQFEQFESPHAHDDIVQHLPMGEQLAFRNLESSKNIGAPVASFCGPRGHAIPALMQSSLEGAPPIGSLLLENTQGLYEVYPSQEELRLGLLIGRSRRCIMGQGFDEKDGLSRVHALVMRLGKHIYAFDLASRYGLRDASRPSKLVSSIKLEEGAGVLVYGAGHLQFNVGSNRS